MPNRRSWSDEQLINAVGKSMSIRAVISELGLIPAGGNYTHVKARMEFLNLDTSHFRGKAWNKGITYHTKVRPILATLLIKGSAVQSYKLKKRLFEEGIKTQMCEMCGWCERSIDGRIPLELDHINGDHSDNRISNLRVLCPNCHSLQPTHRGKNKRVALARVVE